MMMPHGHRLGLLLGGRFGLGLPVEAGVESPGKLRNFIRDRTAAPQRGDGVGPVVAAREPEREGGAHAAFGGLFGRGLGRGFAGRVLRGGARGLGGVEQRQETRPVAGDDLGQHLLARPRAGLDHAVEPREHREAEARVHALAADEAAVVLAHDRAAFLIAPDRAVEQFVGEALARDEDRGAPADAEGRALCPLAQLIGGGGGHLHMHGGDLDRSAVGEMFEEAALERRGPVVAAGCGDVGGVWGLVFHRVAPVVG
ncbi:hypothetical protein [Sphingopyxis sp. PET50]|uniref:hypothetical protein n=1 Tax=Sphingopyxis sp. PET50 TaxID=2976533 RepID=UPI0021AE6B35|nr:hypothetical protein [Sphingopyxis sp. PET50]